MNALLESKARQLNARGLMSYPTDSPDDLMRVEGVAALLASASQPIQLRLPHSKVKVAFDPGLPPQLLNYLAVGDYEQSDPQIAAEFHIEANFALNELAVTLVKGAAVRSDYPAEKVRFYVHPDYWRSSLAGHDGARTIDADALRLHDLLARYSPTTLALDIEGGEVMILRETLPEPVKKVFVEIHTPTLGTQATAEIVSRFTGMGFRLRRP